MITFFEMEQIYFKIPKLAFKYWSTQEVQQLKEDIVYEVNRENSFEKLEDFFDRIHDLIFLIQRDWMTHKQLETSSGKSLAARITLISKSIGSSYEIIKMASLAITFILNLFVLIYYTLYVFCFFFLIFFLTFFLFFICCFVA